jgi:hypothetical protein
VKGLARFGRQSSQSLQWPHHRIDSSVYKSQRDGPEVVRIHGKVRIISFNLKKEKKEKKKEKEKEKKG